MPTPTASAPPPEAGHAMRRVLWLGVLLRVAVGVCLAPANNDPHVGFLEFMSEHGRLPIGGEVYISFHPPLYYLTAAPLWFLSGSAKVVQLLSLAYSLANLGLIYAFLRSTTLLASERGRLHALALAALLPQFVLFSGFLSNDSPAYLIGTGLLLLALRLIEAPSTRRICGLALLAGVGLLTKGTSIAYLPLLGVLVVVLGLRQRWSWRRQLGHALLFTVLAGGVGSYKFVENYVHFGTPILSTDEVPQTWLAAQQGTYQGVSSLVDLDVTELLREPELSEATKHSIPLLFYGTFWYSHINESNFDHTRAGPWDVLPRAIYGLAVVPTLLMALGLMLGISRALVVLRWRSVDDAAFRRALSIAVVVGALLGQVGLVMTWGLAHDAWSFFQARLVFAAFPSLTLLLAWGLEGAGRDRPGVGRGLSWTLVVLYAVTCSYLAVEMVFELSGA